MSKEVSVKKFLREDHFQWLVVICCELIFIGFVCSRALASIGMIALLLSSLLHSGLAESFKSYFQRKELWVLSLFFLVVFFSGIYSEDKTSWLNWVRIKLPYLALPIAFAALKKLELRKFIALLYAFVITFFISTVIVIAHYFLNYTTITESFLRGNSIPMPFSHIRFTLMVSFAFFCCWFLVERKKYLYHKNEKWVQLVLLLFFFFSLHLLSVRSSLLALYLGIFFLLARFIFFEKKYLSGIVAMILLILASCAAYEYMPSLKNKIEYMRYDYHSFRKGEVKNLSDGVRLISMQGGWNLAKQNLCFGVGAGDLRAEMIKFYAEHYPQLDERDHKMPHNQLIWSLASTGFIGLVLFLFAFLFPLFANGNYKHWLLLILHLILFSSFFTEATLEEQMGTGFYLTLLLILINQQQDE